MEWRYLLALGLSLAMLSAWTLQAMARPSPWSAAGGSCSASTLTAAGWRGLATPTWRLHLRTLSGMPDGSTRYALSVWSAGLRKLAKPPISIVCE